MKRKTIMLCMLICFGLVSCWHRRGISIQYRESKHYYSMDAWFYENRTRAVEEYIDNKVGDQSNLSFVHTRMDAEIVLDDHATFFIKKSPGHLKIEMDKDKNSYDSYREIKSLCEGIKQVVK